MTTRLFQEVSKKLCKECSRSFWGPRSFSRRNSRLLRVLPRVSSPCNVTIPLVLNTEKVRRNILENEIVSHLIPVPRGLCEITHLIYQWKCPLNSDAYYDCGAKPAGLITSARFRTEQHKRNENDGTPGAQRDVNSNSN